MYQASIFVMLAAALASCQSVTGVEFTAPDSSSHPDWLKDMNTGCFTPNRQPSVSALTINNDGNITQMNVMEDQRRQAEIMGQAYQVIATLADAANLSDDAEVQRALNYFSANVYQENFLPFSINPTTIEENAKDQAQVHQSGDAS